VKDAKMSPEFRSAKSSTNNLLPGSMRDHWQSLSEISSKEHGDSSKMMINIHEISQSAVKAFQNVTVQHGYLITDDERGALEKLMQEITLFDVACAVLKHRDRDFETGVSSTSTWEKERSNSRGCHT
jgi:hypothetical protein